MIGNLVVERCEDGCLYAWKKVKMYVSENEGALMYFAESWVLIVRNVLYRSGIFICRVATV